MCRFSYLNLWFGIIYDIEAEKLWEINYGAGNPIPRILSSEMNSSSKMAPINENSPDENVANDIALLIMSSISSLSLASFTSVVSASTS